MQIFPADLPPETILAQAIEERPSRQMRRGEWRIGNVHRLDGDGYYFKLGKRQAKLKEQVREGDFEEEFLEESLSTHVVLDARLEVSAIVSKPELASSPLSLARQLRALVQSSEACKSRAIDVEIDPIKDPANFLNILRSASRIEGFRFVVTRPNMFDTEKLFVKPTEEFVRQASFGEAVIQLKDPKGAEGGSLETLEPIIRNAAATGQDVSARVRLTSTGRPILKHLNRNYVTEEIGEDDPKEGAEGILARIRRLYESIRHSNGRD